jgi:hypothetical protein
MSKLRDLLDRQLKIPKYSKDAEDCIKIYNKLSELENGSVWSSQWNILTTIAGFEGKFPNAVRMFKPSKIGYIFLKGLSYPSS